MFADRHFTTGSFREHFDELVVLIGKEGVIASNLSEGSAKARGTRVFRDSPTFLLNQGLFERSVGPSADAIGRGAF